MKAMNFSDVTDINEYIDEFKDMSKDIQKALKANANVILKEKLADMRTELISLASEIDDIERELRA